MSGQRGDAHIIQDAAVKGVVDGYRYSQAPSMVLTTANHLEATRAQRVERFSGTYGDERKVAERALARALRPRASIAEGLAAADRYFGGFLGLADDTQLHPAPYRP